MTQISSPSNIIKKLIISTASLILVSVSIKAYSDDITPDAAAQAAQKDIEIIGVVGDQPLSYFKRLLRQKEDQFFSLTNELVSDDDFKVKCGTTLMQGFSRLKTRKCEAQFVSRLVGEQTQEQFDLMSLSTRGNLSAAAPLLAMRNNQQVQKRIQRRQQEYLNELTNLINSNPELLTAFNELELAKKKLALKQAE
ncbi:hypothetical protein [Glaciecola sp. SC05]|uniref:hypothetical protein n=1 Tax=Glaciecola sp. SC05 TaxID=1987355 RepID=UPI0035283F5E